MAQECRAYVTQHFAWDKTFGKLLAIYENLHKVGNHALSYNAET
jgi:hypothetical protein